MSSVDNVTEHAPLALVDLGDTLAECTPALEAAIRQGKLGANAASEEQRRRTLLESSGFWSGLEPRLAGMQLIALLRTAGYRVMVLTKGPQYAPQVWADKVAWCRTHLPGIPVTVTDDKSTVAGAVLVDDWPPYVDLWQRRWPDGFAIVPAQSWNADIAPSPRLIRDDGTNRAAIAAALRDRRPARKAFT